MENSHECDACAAYQCAVRFPGTLKGKYLDPQSPWKSLDGQLCILHWPSLDKDAFQCDVDVENKRKAGDYNFRGMWLPSYLDNSALPINQDFWHATVGDMYLIMPPAQTDFVGTTFLQNAVFRFWYFSGPVNFSGATFKEGALFECESPGSPQAPTIGFSEIRFERADKIHFRNLTLSNIYLLGTDMRAVEFTNVEWPSRLREEVQAPKELYPFLEKLYRQLRQNYEDSGNYPDAGRFYYREMEMRRKAKWWRRYLPSLPALYWLSSGYGQKPRRAAFVILLLVVIFSLAYMAAGLHLDSGAKRSLSEPVLWGSGGILSWTANFFRAALHTLQVLTFSRSRTFVPINWEGEVLIVLETILVPLQVALFVLAVRRQFQR